jgi:ribosome-associated protein
MIPITDTIFLDENDLAYTYTRSSGPGGQNVNKISSAVQLRFDLARNTSLPADVRQRLAKLAGTRITAEGTLIIHAQRYRSQSKNRQDAINRLVVLVRQAAISPKKRRKTKPSTAAKTRRLKQKKRRSELKRLRKSPRIGD